MTEKVCGEAHFLFLWKIDLNHTISLENNRPMASVASQAVPSLVKYENATLVSNTKDKKAAAAKGKQADDKTQLAFTEEILNSILPPRYFLSSFSIATDLYIIILC